MGSLNHCGKDSRFQVHQDCTGHVAPSSGFVEVDINAFLEQTILAGGKGIQRISHVHIHYQIGHQQVQVKSREQRKARPPVTGKMSPSQQEVRQLSTAQEKEKTKLYGGESPSPAASARGRNV